MTDTVARFLDLLESKGVKLFVVIDQRARLEVIHPLTDALVPGVERALVKERTGLAHSLSKEPREPSRANACAGTEVA